MYGFFGFIIGFVAGMILNMFLLKGIPPEKMRSDKNMRLVYGGLNWVIAVIGLVIGLYLQDRL